jgi:hypothetical protein
MLRPEILHQIEYLRFFHNNFFLFEKKFEIFEIRKKYCEHFEL